jgi:branched-chain amino acid transport system substrate-binding protein
MKQCYFSHFVSAAIFLAPAAFAEPARIVGRAAAFLPLTGSAAEQGDWIRAGLELGKEEAENELGVSLDLRFEETMADPKQAVSAYQNLKSRENFKIAFTYGSGVGIALSAITNQDKVIQIGLATASPAYRSAEDYTFRNFPSAELEARFLVDSAVKILNATELGILKIENDYGLGTAKAFRSEYEKAGGKVLFEEEIEPGATDFRSLLTRIRRVNPKVIYIASYPGEGATACGCS